MNLFVKYNLKVLAPISVVSFAILFSLYVDRKQRVAGILVCEKPLGERPVLSGLSEQFAEATERFERNLAESTTVDDLVVSTVISSFRNSDVSSLETLSELSEHNQDNQFAAIQLLNACKESIHPSCNNEMVNHAIALDGENGATWALVAGFRYSNEDAYGALVALEAAVEAPDYDDYFQKGIQLVVNALPTAHDDLAIQMYINVINHGITLTVNSYSSLLPVVAMCSENVVENQRLVNACLSFGRRVEQQASSLLGSGMGHAIESTTYQALGDVAEVQRREEEARRTQNDRFSGDSRLASNLLEYDAQLFRFWLDQLILSGEQAAMESLGEEARRLSSQWNYDPCPNVLFGNLIFTVADFSRWALSKART
ncbi:MAG: hypothetical protein GKR91_10330 [Pseudomonadales bacterium]|nr:hypothetical protein [Pseudomonadales bacterium]